MDQPTFAARYYPDRLHLVNPTGDVGILTLWSSRDKAETKLTHAVPGILDPARSRVAVVSNLYGDGMYAMLCNLLLNPQVRHLVAVGADRNLPTCREIEAFLKAGLEDAVLYGRPVKRIRGTDRLFPALAEFDEERLRSTLTFRDFGGLDSLASPETFAHYLDALPHVSPAELPEPVLVDLTESESDEQRPSQIEGHLVVRSRPLDCWEELVARAVRFGRRVELRDGPRLELLNAKAVITDPVSESPDVLELYGFSSDQFESYQQDILDARLPEDISYTYGNRLRGYFPQGPSTRDTLRTVVELLSADPESRRGYVSLWDTANDLPSGGGGVALPCLTTLFFRRSDGRLTMTATYRSHNLLTAWLKNVYGLMAIQRHVAQQVAMPVGSLTVVSHSLGIDPRNPLYKNVGGIVDAWRDDALDRASGKRPMREDPNGYFDVGIDVENRRLVVEHRTNGLLIKTYDGRTAAMVEHKIVTDMGVSLVSHAMWLGRELATKEQELRERIRSAGGS
jgi:thymidylate synthase